MTIALKMGDRTAMKLWSWLGACSVELLTVNPAYVAAHLTPDMVERITVLGPRVAQWLLDVAEAAKAIKQRDVEKLP